MIIQNTARHVAFIFMLLTTVRSLEHDGGHSKPHETTARHCKTQCIAQ